MRTVRTNARATLAAIAAGVAIIVTAVPAAAISSENSSPAPERTEVGFLGLAVDLNGDGEIDLIDGFCSGTMIDDDTFLTAAHCTDDPPSGLHFFVSLEEDILTKLIATSHLPAAEFIDLWADQRLDRSKETCTATLSSAPAPGSPASDQHDIAVIDFADRDTTPADLWTFTPATLPTAGQLDAIGGRALDGYDWWVVGYGVQEALEARAVSPIRPSLHAGRRRRTSARSLNSGYSSRRTHPVTSVASATATPVGRTSSTSTAR